MPTTNYFNTLIKVSPDSKATIAVVPEYSEKPTLARRIYEQVYESPYRYTSDEVLIKVMAEQRELSYEDAANLFYSKGQACLRSSLLVKKYGWGIHFDCDGKMALAAIGQPEYNRWIADENCKKVDGMRSKRAQ